MPVPSALETDSFAHQNRRIALGASAALEMDADAAVAANTIALTDDTLVVRGGTLELAAATLADSGNVNLVLLDSAKVRVPSASDVVRVRSVRIGGFEKEDYVPSVTRHTATACEWVVGAGAVKTEYPSSGCFILFH